MDIILNFVHNILILLHIDPTSKLASSIIFFVEDGIKIFLLIFIMLFVVALFRAQLNPDNIKHYLKGKSSLAGYLLAVALGVVTPFCSCSSIPLFIAFTAAGIPFGITMAFLISSPLISEVAVILLLTIPSAGLKGAFFYILAGTIISVAGGYLCDKFKLSKYIVQNEKEKEVCHCHGHEKLEDKVKSTVKYAYDYSISVVEETAPYVIAGLLIGAIMHGFVPQEFFVQYLGKENIFAIPTAAFAGIPIYANHNSVLPIIQILLDKGVPLGTTLVMLMSITAISLPEIVMLNKVLNWKMLGIFVFYLFVSFILVGYILNFII